MAEQTNPTTALFRKRFEALKKLSAKLGEKKALETMFAGYSEQLKKRMAPYIDKATLADGLRKAVAEFKHNGWDMDVVDISNNGKDAALEIQKVCPAKEISREFGYDRPCFLVCDPDGPAIKKAFPDMKAETLCRQADGDCICMFKFERKSRPA